MVQLASLASEISFLHVAGALVVTGLIERVLYLLPPSVVGDGGWLLDTGAE